MTLSLGFKEHIIMTFKKKSDKIFRYSLRRLRLDQIFSYLLAKMRSLLPHDKTINTAAAK